MKIIDYGTWMVVKTSKNPKYKELEGVGLRVVILENDAGEDWYEKVAHNPATDTGITVMVSPEGIVAAAEANADQLCPLPNHKVYHLPELDPAAVPVGQLMGKVFNPVTGEFTTKPKEKVTVVSGYQAKKALIRRGHMTKVKGRLDLKGEETRLDFEHKAQWRLDSPMVQAIGAELAMTQADMAELFEFAATF